MALDFSRCRLAPFAHQREDVAWLMERPYAFIASEMRTGKSKIVIDAAQFLFEAGVIDKVIVVAPAPVRDVWFDSQLGELAKHLWTDVPCTITEYHARVRAWQNAFVGAYGDRLHWLVTNFEFLRSKNRLTQLLPACGQKTLLVGDESSFLKNHAAQQTKAFLTLRKQCGRVVLLNGTPIFHDPLDLFSQGNILHRSILDCKFITLFKARYAVQTPIRGFGGKALLNPWGKPIQEITGWTNLDDLERRFKPCTVRRLQAECLDLPPKLDPVTLTATLDTSWPHYKSMRDDLVVWLSQNTVATSATAAIKTLRLSQITGGFLGGVEDSGIDPVDEGLLKSLDFSSFGPHLPDTDKFVTTSGYTALPTTIEDGLLDSLNLGNYNGRNDEERRDVRAGEEGLSTAGHEARADAQNTSGDPGDTESQSTPARLSHIEGGVEEVGREKLDVLFWFIEQRLASDPNLHLVAWGRFRAEVFRAEREVKKRFPQFQTAIILGGQKKEDRLAALALLKPETSPVGPVFVCGIEGTGSFGLDMTAAHTCVTMSSGYSPGRSAQTLDRVYGPGQIHPVAYYDIVAVGPRGQKTIDHDILVARRAGEDVARRTAAAWVKALTEK